MVCLTRIGRSWAVLRLRSPLPFKADPTHHKRMWSCVGNLARGRTRPRVSLLWHEPLLAQCTPGEMNRFAPRWPNPVCDERPKVEKRSLPN
ncbi:hypothetical protein HRbin30_02811 [bacterium HR30]|nr:hypothetical protein HRbin30_02811 [bacterium HR30]